jgi:SulP family sulfate permease
MRIRSMLTDRGIELHISGLKLPVETVLRKAGALDEGPLLHMYRTDSEALLAFGRLSP